MCSKSDKCLKTVLVGNAKPSKDPLPRTGLITFWPEDDWNVLGQFKTSWMSVDSRLKQYTKWNLKLII